MEEWTRGNEETADEREWSCGERGMENRGTRGKGTGERGTREVKREKQREGHGRLRGTG
jgi:hypothetical protein